MSLEEYKGKIVVVKYGGNAMKSEELKKTVISDVAELSKNGIKVVLCHGGGPGINKMLEKLDIKSEFINGLRYTSKEILEVVKMVLIGQVNSELVSLLNKEGIKAVGLSGISDKMFLCEKENEELGYVGKVVKVNKDLVEILLEKGYLPVIAPLGTDGKGTDFNINGDTASGELAGALQAEKFILLTDIEGLCNNIEEKDVISYLNIDDVDYLKEKGIIKGGMIPKVDCCRKAVESGVKNVHIIDGRKEHSILIQAFNQGYGTTIGKDKESVGLKR